MILYNVTVSIESTIEQDWLSWMKTVHIPNVMATECFIEARISRVHAEEQGGLSYAISYIASTEEKYVEYQERYAAPLQREHGERYEGRFAAFRTLLTVVEEFKL
jgi:hypothetical protein